MDDLKLKTKYFGEISFDKIYSAHDLHFINVKYKNEGVHIAFTKHNIYRDKPEICLEILDKYEEINEITKKAIIENFSKDITIKTFFEEQFDDWSEETNLKIFGVKTFDEFDEMHIKKTVEKLDYPYLIFGIKNKEICLSVDYSIDAKINPYDLLCVKMDKNLNVLDFLHESIPDY